MLSLPILFRGGWVPLDPYRVRGQSLTVFQDKVPLSEKLDQIMTWIDLPLEKRPQFISGSLLAAIHRI